jgi:hypothetical protein
VKLFKATRHGGQATPRRAGHGETAGTNYEEVVINVQDIGRDSTAIIFVKLRAFESLCFKSNRRDFP